MLTVSWAHDLAHMLPFYFSDGGIGMVATNKIILLFYTQCTNHDK